MKKKSVESPLPDPELADRIHSLAIRLLRRLRRVDELTGLSAPGLSALSVVVFSGPLSLGDLASAEQVRPPSMTRIVGDMQARGLVKIETDEADRRVMLVRATAKGTRILHQGRSRRVGLLAEAIAGLTTSERALVGRATAILDRLVRAL